MTDSSSSDMADMASELLSAKMEAAKKEGQMTHVLRIGSFHMEIVPSAEAVIKSPLGAKHIATTLSS